MKYRMPKRLVGGDTVGIYSPSGSFSDAPDKMSLFQNGVRKLRALGFEVIESEHCRSSWFHASASPADRVKDFNAFMIDDRIDIVLPSIGGHVASQLLPLLDFDSFATYEKALFGFSDNSILPLVITDRTGLCTFHTLCDVTFGFGRFEDAKFKKTESSFMNAVNKGQFSLAQTMEMRVIQPGQSEGIIVGGNLKGITSLAGTPWWPNLSGKILFWESADPLHAVMQQLVHLANAGAFLGLAGMIIGRISTLRESFYRKDQIIPIDDLLLEVLGLRGRFPIIAEVDIGHDVENVTIPLGATVRLSADRQVCCDIHLPAIDMVE